MIHGPHKRRIAIISCVRVYMHPTLPLCSPYSFPHQKPTTTHAAHYTLQLLDLCIDGHLGDLIQALVFWDVQPVLVGDVLAQEPAADEMALALVELDARLGGRQADQVVGHELCADLALVGRAGLDVPARGDVDGQHGDVAFFHALDGLVEGRAHRRLEGEAEERVDNQAGRAEG